MLFVWYTLSFPTSLSLAAFVALCLPTRAARHVTLDDVRGLQVIGYPLSVSLYVVIVVLVVVVAITFRLHVL